LQRRDARAYIYWTIWNPHGANNRGTLLGRANLDGTHVNRRFITGLKGPFGLAVDTGGPG